jgi:hypothetical protein
MHISICRRSGYQSTRVLISLLTCTFQYLPQMPRFTLREKLTTISSFFRAKRRSSEPNFWTSCGEDVSSLSSARLRQSSATLLSGVRPFPRNAPSAVLLMGAAPRAHKPSPQSSSTAFRADLRCAAPLSASLSLRCKRWVIPLGLHLLPLPSPPGGSGVVG